MRIAVLASTELSRTGLEEVQAHRAGVVHVTMATPPGEYTPVPQDMPCA